MSKTFVDLTGRRFGRLVVLERVDKKKVGYILPSTCAYWKCMCDCGNETIVASSALLNDKTRSCGCLRRELLGKRRRELKKNGLN